MFGSLFIVTWILSGFLVYFVICLSSLLVAFFDLFCCAGVFEKTRSFVNILVSFLVICVHFTL